MDVDGAQTDVEGAQTDVDGAQTDVDGAQSQTDVDGAQIMLAVSIAAMHAQVNSLDDFCEINRGIPLYPDTYLENVNLQLSAANTVQQRRNIYAVEGDGRKTGEVPIYSDEQRDVRTLFLKKLRRIMCRLD